MEVLEEEEKASCREGWRYLKRKRRHHVGKDGSTEEEEKALCRKGWRYLKRKRRHHVGKDGSTEEEEKVLCRACQATSLSHPDALVVMQLSIDHLAVWKCCIQSIKPN